MKTLQSYVEGRWHEASGGFTPLHNPATEAVIAQASSAGIDFGAALAYARRKGRAALGELTFVQRGELLKTMSKALHARRDELLALSVENTGTTRRDAKFDLDGATFTLAHYARLGQALGDRRVLADGEGAQLGQSARYWGQHVLLPLDGCAVLINAFNFPAWGFGEKAACAILAGMPVVLKPATSTALVAERSVRILVEAGCVPDGVVSLVCGSTGDLLDRLGSQDVLAFTGSAATALALRSRKNLLEKSTRVNVEADSLNAAVLGPDVAPGSETWSVFVNDVVREITQKTGQKCTAVRRILVPAGRLDDVQAALADRLAAVVTGNPEDAAVTMGPLATGQQLDDALAGVVLLRGAARLVHGSGERVDGLGAAPSRGWFLGPTLLRADDPRAAGVVHSHEVFGPVSTLLGYDGSAVEAAAAVALADGTLVTSIYSDDAAFLRDYLTAGGSFTGRVYLGSEKVAGQLPGSGTAMPDLQHGGPGRAGGGAELGGLRGLALYQQRVALSGDRAIVERLAELR